MVDRPIFWLGSSREDVRAFPPDARRLTGFQLRRVQHGLKPNDWKPMPRIGTGVQEIRVHTELEYRVFYIAKFPEAIYVLHAFEKRTRKTPKRDLELARNPLRALLLKRRNDRGVGG